MSTRRLTIITICLFVNLVQAGNLEDGENAFYKKKDYTTALNLLLEPARQGNPKAQRLVGSMYLKAQGVNKNTEQAQYWLHKAADQGETNAQAYLCYMYAQGDGVKKDIDQTLKWCQLAADKGEVTAQDNLGSIYDKGEILPRDVLKAILWYHKAADQGFASAQVELGIKYYNGDGVAKDYGKALAWFKKAATQGDTSAQFYIGHMYEHGNGVHREENEAIKWYLQAAEHGHVEAQYDLGSLYSLKSSESKHNELAAKWFAQAAAKNHAMAKYQLAELYLSGTGVNKSTKIALKLLNEVANQEHSLAQCFAQFKLGLLYKRGDSVAIDYFESVNWFDKAKSNLKFFLKNNSDYLKSNNGQESSNMAGFLEIGITKTFIYFILSEPDDFLSYFECEDIKDIKNCLPRNPTEVINRYQHLAKHGDMHAQTILGNLYYWGEVVKQDYSKAYYWYIQAATQGYAPAQARVGILYELGKGPSKDIQKALYWYQKAVEQNNIVGELSLASLYLHGKSISKDAALGFKYIKMAADQNNKEAQHEMGNLYRKGIGTSQNYREALYWYRKAINNGMITSQSDVVAILKQFNCDSVSNIDSCVPVSDQMEFEWELEKAQHGDVLAQKSVAWKYYNGKGVKRDCAQSLKWFHEAESQADEDAARMEITLYFDGTCMKDNPDEIFRITSKFANLGYVRHQAILGQLYEKGYGVAVNKNLAIHWYSEAAKNGDKDAKTRLEKLNEEKSGFEDKSH